MTALVICPTYGRLPYLGRVLAGFLRQTYQNKHLVFINDDQYVTLKCSYDNVTCINMRDRMLLPHKRNLGIAYKEFDVIFSHDDDDIFLPNRIANHIRKYVQHPDINLYRNSSMFITYGERFYKANLKTPNDVSFLKRAWHEIGGYTLQSSRGDDDHLYNSMDKKLVEDDPSNMDFVYNISGINYHLSSGDSDELIARVAYEQLIEMNIHNKPFNIEPDIEEYNKFLRMAVEYQLTGSPVNFKHYSTHKIEICSPL
jgi:glycosyltransferase involved in cell wall biosynthesis